LQRKYNKFLRGHRVPSFYMKNLQTIVRDIAEKNLTSEDFFIADIVVSSESGPCKIFIFLDGDNGVSIDDCVALSRAVANVLEEEDLVDSKYTLDVSSPGVDFPLNSERQYNKNVGRGVKVITTAGTELRGKLINVTANGIALDKEVKKGNKVSHEPIELAYEDIKRTIVQVSFK
jgi:ribosome maturation factor RimP